MTRAEFIAMWIANRRHAGDCATEIGVSTRMGTALPPARWVALPCGCGEPACHGWQMIPAQVDMVELHLLWRGRDAGGEPINPEQLIVALRRGRYGREAGALDGGNGGGNGAPDSA